MNKLQELENKQVGIKERSQYDLVLQTKASMLGSKKVRTSFKFSSHILSY